MSERHSRSWRIRQKLFREPLRRAISKYSVYNRKRKAARIAAFADAEGCKTVLMVGAVGFRPDWPNEGVIERAVMDGRDVVMGINVTDEDVPYPFMKADARDMPFESNFVDLALSNAIIEHVGDESDQRRFINEHTRVARAWVITTPNRWFPIEAHTSAVLRHYSPKWRAKRHQFTRLLSYREFTQMLPPGTKVDGWPWSTTFTAYYSRMPEADAHRRLDGAAEAGS